MPLIHDPEYQEELDKATAAALSNNRSFWWRSLLGSAVFLAVVVFLLNQSGFKDSTSILIMLGACTVCIVAVVNSAVTAIHTTLVIVAGAVEWVGRKQLGEYKAPD